MSIPPRLDDENQTKERVQVLAYVFWHWKQGPVSTIDYETKHRAFHAAIASAPPSGFVESFSVTHTGAPWVPSGGDAHEDWYLVKDFAALASLNRGAVSGARRAPHTSLSAVSGGGTGGLYELQVGVPTVVPRFAYWFQKRPGIAYNELIAELSPLVDTAGGALWLRKMALGPASECCIHAGEPIAVPPTLAALALPLRPLWPEVD